MSPAEQLKNLQTRITQVPVPQNLWTGLQAQQNILPGNILMFPQVRPIIHTEAHHHHRFVLIVNTKTEGTVILDNAVFRLCQGQALLIFPFQFHHYANFASDSICWLFITFEIQSPNPYTKLRNMPVTLSPRALQYVDQAVDLYVSQTGPETTNEITLLGGLVLSEMIQAPQARTAAQPSADPDARTLVHKIGQLLYANLDKPLQVSDFARHVAMSESHLRNTFKEKCGISLGRYIRRCRIIRACNLMETTPMSISEISHACGFASVYAFSRTFKHEMNLSPRQYRRERAEGQ